jgi:hypothetical protein
MTCNGVSSDLSCQKRGASERSDFNKIGVRKINYQYLPGKKNDLSIFTW